MITFFGATDGADFAMRTLRATIAVGLLAALSFAVYVSPGWGVGVGLGSLWAAANLALIRATVRLAAKRETLSRNEKLLLALVLLVKFPALYVAGWFLLTWGYAPAISFLVGFSPMFVVIVLKATARAILHLDESPPTTTQDASGGSYTS